MLVPCTTALMHACYSADVSHYTQIWSAVAGNNASLSKQQFYTAMRLVSAAQVQQWSARRSLSARDCPPMDHMSSEDIHREDEDICATCCCTQRGGGTLSQSEARSILIGLGPALPPPNMAGLEQLKPAVPQILSQVVA